ncbi:uncharacterized protein BT62DRAFT_248614 [Guyanagaster necrorhizus]|uniref:Uncharacterized protein n=1 Tax=Guyanagaster necrorhizus TaxID=856835 RepID=A0A9P8AQW7_9AGAR|nr:uncharacterized protein BT62DRAFT_248614 [Guyanagaster necrorhizus MCA 3950]KAG7444559.1 hypothetical protein BT62DRAFT_248614 [Guyanagaster necrorhizus MCA 3950]
MSLWISILHTTFLVGYHSIILSLSSPYHYCYLSFLFPIYPFLLGLFVFSLLSSSICKALTNLHSSFEDSVTLSYLYTHFSSGSLNVSFFDFLFVFL